MTHSTLLKSLAAVAAGLLVLSCVKTVETVLSLSDLSANFEATGALEKTVSVTSNADWTVSCPDAWVSVSPATGTGNGAFKITVAEYDKFQTRTSTVTVRANDKTATVKVSQLPLTPSILVSPTALEVDAAGGTVSVDVTSNATWTVSVPSAAGWATPDVTSGERSKKVTFTIAPNTDFEARSVDVTFNAEDKSAVVKISQTAPTPSLEVSPATLSVDSAGGPLEVNVTSNAPWTVTLPEGCDWMTADPASGTGNAKVVLTVATNIARINRNAVVTIKETVSNIEKTVSVDQGMAPLSRQTDSLALVAVYNVADGANWKESRRWTLENPMDTWPGIKLNKEGRVIELSITNGTVTTVEWELPAAIADLTELSVFQAVGSKVKGNFPDFLYSLTKLTKLVVNSNNITGSLSEKVANWTEMTNLYVNNNKQFGGSLPVALSTLKQLINLNIAQTAISGAVPAELSGCESLQSFMAYETEISSIPDNWDQWPALKIIQLYGNKKLVCPLPASIGNMKKVTSLQLKNGNFTGNIPESYANLPTTCTQLFLNGNRLSGVVPAAVQAHPKWKAASDWKYEVNILPQQDGYGLTLHSGSGGQNLDQPVDENPWN